MSRIFNQLLNVKGTVVEDARIADSPLRPEPVLCFSKLASAL
jgi:hypothetical protein